MGRARTRSRRRSGGPPPDDAAPRTYSIWPFLAVFLVLALVGLIGVLLGYSTQTADREQLQIPQTTVRTLPDQVPDQVPGQVPEQEPEASVPTTAPAVTPTPPVVPPVAPPVVPGS